LRYQRNTIYLLQSLSDIGLSLLRYSRRRMCPLEIERLFSSGTVIKSVSGCMRTSSSHQPGPLFGNGILFQICLLRSREFLLDGPFLFSCLLFCQVAGANNLIKNQGPELAVLSVLDKQPSLDRRGELAQTAQRNDKGFPKHRFDSHIANIPVKCNSQRICNISRTQINIHTMPADDNKNIRITFFQLSTCFGRHLFYYRMKLFPFPTC